MIDASQVFGTNARKRYLVGVPFGLVLALLAPVALLLAPIILVASLVAGIHPVAAFRALWHVLTALRGTHVEIAQRDRSVLIHLRRRSR